MYLKYLCQFCHQFVAKNLENVSIRIDLISDMKYCQSDVHDAESCHTVTIDENSKIDNIF